MSIAALPFAIMIGGMILMIAPSFFVKDRHDDRR